MQQTLADEVFTTLCGLRRREWKALQKLGGGVDRRYRLRSWFVSLCSFANELTSRPTFASCRTESPIVILGHWRSGTTLLHELLAMHPELAAPTFVDVILPTANSFQRRVFAGLLHVFLPRRRPVDGAPIGPNRPAEDDFALAALGMSPYLAWTFPRRAEFFERFLDLDGLSGDERESWRREMTGLVSEWTERKGRTLVLKSPPHTARLGELSSLFPEAKFVFLPRDPFRTFGSAMRLTLDGTKPLRLQELSDEVGRAGVLRRATKMFNAYRRDRRLLPKERLLEISYEELIADPVAVSERVLIRFGIATDEPTRERKRRFLRDSNVRSTPQMELSATDRADVRTAFAFLFDEYGYKD